MLLNSLELLQRSKRHFKDIIKVWTASRKLDYSSGMARNMKVTANNVSEKARENVMPSISSGNISLSAPIGYIKSCFKSKNGTPRQPTVCSYSRAKLRILKSVFVCPNHSVEGMAEFSHIWVLFVFHQNSQETFAKAKVKPPRLDGRKVGVFASRTPHRPNPIGLTLARLDKVEGDTLYLSGMDMIDGTPVLDIKPYVPEYDSPNLASVRMVDDRRQTNSLQDQETSCEPLSSTTGTHIERRGIHGNRSDLTFESEELKGNCDKAQLSCYSGGDGMNAGRRKEKVQSTPCSSKVSGSVDTSNSMGDCEVAPPTSNVGGASGSSGGERTCNLQVGTARVDAKVTRSSRDDSTRSSEAEGDVDARRVDVRVAGWVSAPPVRPLSVRFTPSAEAQLAAFWQEENKGRDDYKMEFLRDATEAHCAIKDILSADPRSVYRRKDCTDRLYFFTLDNLHITCWFGPDFAEVLQVQPISQASVPTSGPDCSPSKKLKPL